MAGDVFDALGFALARGATEVHLVRHADAVPPADDDLPYDAYDLQPLSARGRLQAEAAADALRAVELAAVYASPIQRARETAEAIAAPAGLGVTELPDLREVALGRLDGPMPLRERLDALAAMAIRDGSWAALPGTEPSAAVRARMRAALDALAARHPGARVAAVSHAGAINALLGALAGTPHDFLFPLANASISVVRVREGRALLLSANETGHLRDVTRAAR